MIQTVRFNTEDFIGTDFEDVVWDKLKDCKKKSKFKILFYVTHNQNMKAVTDCIMKHDDALSYKTEIQLEDLAMKHRVFLEVENSNNLLGNTDYRFKITAPAPINLMKAIDFMDDHRSFTENQGKTAMELSKKQKRNDSNEYDYNKK
tara:strand:+ start:169 stop:609 length:441 start_codon:yes stop_codon:yes gene_type:complete